MIFLFIFYLVWFWFLNLLEDFSLFFSLDLFQFFDEFVSVFGFDFFKVQNLGFWFVGGDFGVSSVNFFLEFFQIDNWFFDVLVDWLLVDHFWSVAFDFDDLGGGEGGEGGHNSKNKLVHGWFVFLLVRLPH